MVRLRTLNALDSRTHAARRAFSIMAGLFSDLGGMGNAGTAEKQLVQRASVLAARIEDAEARWLEGEEIDVAAHLAAVNCQRRLLEAIGLKRVPRDVTPSLQDYIAEKGREKASKRQAEDASFEEAGA